MSQSSRVANHYNQRPEVGTARRQESPIIGMKKFNNYTKSLLITKFTPKQSRVLDLACGKGGDLLKWKNQRINSLLGLDIAKISVQQAEKRFRDSRFDFNATFDTIDCFSKDFKLYFQKNWFRFDVVSCQFAIHYCFETEEKLRIVLETIADILEPGGHFIGTVPNSTFVMKNLDNCQGLEFGNSFYKIKFEQRDTRPEFGHKYQFYLEDAIDDCPEYVAHRQSFIRIANEYGLECVLYKGFHDFFRDESQTKEALDLLHRMRVFDHGGRLNELDWETAGIYSCFSFRKIKK
jgi:mRNA (guanine-N7-)-methyltransferase